MGQLTQRSQGLHGAGATTIACLSPLRLVSLLTLGPSKVPRCLAYFLVSSILATFGLWIVAVSRSGASRSPSLPQHQELGSGRSDR